MLDIVLGLPAEVAGLYRVTFERGLDLFGVSFVRAVLALIAVSRAGWRESDLRALVPRVTGESWDSLRFAALRRFFRAQLSQHAALGQWDFNH